jgi:hypothetical protein
VIEAEGVQDKELIIAQAVKDRVMEFFSGVDLEEIGETRVGLLTVRTRYYPQVPEMHHVAELNGFIMAVYSHIPTGVELSQLPTDKDRTISKYVLHGHIHGRGNLSVRYTEFEIQPAQLIVSEPSPAYGDTGEQGSFHELRGDELRSITKPLGIKI